MDTLATIGRVRVIRTYRDEPLPHDALRHICDAGRHAGSSKNSQSWDFILVRRRETLRRLSEVGPYGRHLAASAAAVALITPAGARSASVLWDLGRAAQNMILTAWALGVGSCPVTVYDAELAQQILALPADRVCPYVLGLGWPADPTDLTRAPRAGGRRDYDDVVREEHW